MTAAEIKTEVIMTLFQGFLFESKADGPDFFISLKPLEDIPNIKLTDKRHLTDSAIAKLESIGFNLNRMTDSYVVYSKRFTILGAPAPSSHGMFYVGWRQDWDYARSRGNLHRFFRNKFEPEHTGT